MADVKWAHIRAQLAALDATELLDVLRDLFERSADNRRFLAARLLGADKTEALETYRARILTEFADSEPLRQPRLGEARRAIRDYRRATDDRAGTAELMLTYVEAGTRFSREYGDMSEAYYHSLSVVLNELAEGLLAAPHTYPPLRQRLLALREDSRRVGWTWGVHVAEVVGRLESGLAPD